MSEPAAVQEARRVIREWEMRDGHDAYADPLDGGWAGYQARCWDCDFHGAPYLRVGADAGRVQKRRAQTDAAAHRRDTRVGA